MLNRETRRPIRKMVPKQRHPLYYSQILAQNAGLFVRIPEPIYFNYLPISLPVPILQGHQHFQSTSGRTQSSSRQLAGNRHTTGYAVQPFVNHGTNGPGIHIFKNSDGYSEYHDPTPNGGCLGHYDERKVSIMNPTQVLTPIPIELKSSTASDTISSNAGSYSEEETLPLSSFKSFQTADVPETSQENHEVITSSLEKYGFNGINFPMVAKDCMSPEQHGQYKQLMNSITAQVKDFFRIHQKLWDASDSQSRLVREMEDYSYSFDDDSLAEVQSNFSQNGQEETKTCQKVEYFVPAQPLSVPRGYCNEVTVTDSADSNGHCLEYFNSDENYHDETSSSKPSHLSVDSKGPDFSVKASRSKGNLTYAEIVGSKNPRTILPDEMPSNYPTKSPDKVFKHAWINEHNNIQVMIPTESTFNLQLPFPPYKIPVLGMSGYDTAKYRKDYELPAHANFDIFRKDMYDWFDIGSPAGSGPILLESLECLPTPAELEALQLQFENWKIE
uniref:Uncharacterized protein n=1 Tax=Caenorhabditis japonica TaxID=281687 RepID=A0A8R1HXX4_CAEJA